MGVYESRGMLGKGMKELLLKWQDVKLAWDDPNSHAIEKDFLEPVEADLKQALTAMDQMAIKLQQIRSECE